jgi:hypothetical protein
MRTLLCILLLAAIASAASGVDATGNWSGSFVMTGPNGETKQTGALLKLKQSGTDISGSVGPSEDEQFVIQKGKIEGDKITLEADHGGQTLKIDLVVAADRITGEARMSGDQTVTGKLDVSRAK